MSLLRSLQYEKGGVFLPSIGLWLDPHEPKLGPELVFISHAHSDHTGIHREVILSEPTSKLMRARLEGEWKEHILPYGQAREFQTAADAFHLTLLPAGHVFGSAMALIEAFGERLLYTGDFKMRPGLSAEPCQPAQADYLIMECTYGRPIYQFPKTSEVIQGIVRFCREALDQDETPVLLGYSLGKCQELLCALGDAALPIMLHGQVHKMTSVYQQFGKCFPPFEKYDSQTARGKVLLCPPNVVNSAMMRQLARVRLAVLTGWAVDPGCRFRYQAHAAFPLSDHADYPELLEFVRIVNPKKVFTLHGFAADFAQSLRDLGYDAQALSQLDQLSLPLLVEPSPRRKPVLPKRGKVSSREGSAPAVALPEPDFQGFAQVCAEISQTTKKLEKTAILAAYLKTVQAPALPSVATWFSGSPFASSQNKALQLGWAIIRDALSLVSDISDETFGQVYLKHSDLGETAFELLQQCSLPKPVLRISEVQATFHQLHLARGPSGKLPLLVDLLRQATALEGKYLIKILTGDLRIGLKEGLVEEAIARAFDQPLDQIKKANLLLGDIGETAHLAQRNQLQSITLIPFRPVKYMLASPEETAADIWNRVHEWHHGKADRLASKDLPLPLPPSVPAPVEAWLEDKYDGIRAQVHKVGSSVAIYSRDLKEITSTFPELADRFRSLADDFILDGEIIAARGDQILPFAELQRRLGRKERDLFMGEEIPVRFIAFDLLWRSGRNVLDEPLRERRRQLLELGPVQASNIMPAASAEAIEDAFAAARNRGNEGLMIKDPLSVYTPGRRGLAWLKLKKALATLDCVVVGAEYGHGKRKSVLSDYTFAVRDERTGELKTIGKAYSGLTDQEIAHLTSHFLKTTQTKQGRYHAVVPDTVLEIAFDLLQPSERHTSGLAMRFPRIVRIRTDKTVQEVDTLETARAIAQKSAGVRLL